MEVLARVGSGGREIACGVATTGRGRAAALAQPFGVYQRRGYLRPGLRVDRDAYDQNAVYSLRRGGGKMICPRAPDTRTRPSRGPDVGRTGEGQWRG